MEMHGNVSVVHKMITAWGEHDTETFLILHSNDFTLNFCPNAIPSLQAYTGTMKLNRSGLKAWNERTWGPGKALLPTAPPQWTDFCEVGNKVYMNGVMPVQIWGTPAVEGQRFFFCFTVQDGMITEANVNGDLSSFYGKISSLEQSNTAKVLETTGYWSSGQTEKFLACHSEDVTWNFLPNQIKELKDICTPGQGLKALEKFNEKTFGPGNPFEPLGAPIFDGFHGMGNQVLGTIRMQLKVLGKGPINMEWHMRFTLKDERITNALMLADTTELAKLF